MDEDMPAGEGEEEAGVNGVEGGEEDGADGAAPATNGTKQPLKMQNSKSKMGRGDKFNKPNEVKVTTPYMTKYERARILGTRALQIRSVGPSHACRDKRCAYT